MSPDSGPALGSEFAGHRIEAVLGEGGMGVVYLARHLALDRDRALKVLAPALSGDERFRARFQRESRLAASIEHPNVIPVHEAGEEQGHLYLSMRLVEGRDLRDLVAEGGPLTPQATAEILDAVAGGLGAAHAAGLIHRDVKPANVLVGEGRDAGRVFLTDFGISRTARAGETVTRTGEIIGTADFVSPEQIAGEPVDERADIYALGAVVHFALTGSVPFPRETELATLFAHANAPRPRPAELRSDLPLALDSVVARAMAINPDDRFATAGELATAYDRALEGIETKPLARPPAAEDPSPARDLRRWARPLAVAAAVVLAGAGVTALLVAGGDEDDGGSGGGTSRSEASAPRTETVEIGADSAPVGITVGELRTWVAARDGSLVIGLERNDPAEADMEQIGVPSPVSVAQGGGSIWAISATQDVLYRLDPAIGERSEIQLPGGASPSDIAFSGDDTVWITLEGTGRLARYDAGAQSLEFVTVCEEPRAVATGEGAVWIVCTGDNALAKVDPVALERVGANVELDSQPTDVDAGEGAVWVTDNQAATLTRVDPGAADEPAQIDGEPVAGLNRPRGVKAGMGAVWVANAGDGTVLRYDPGSLTPIGEPIDVGEEPADIALGAGRAWTADQDTGTVTVISP
jgi:streptogramin lyase